MRTILSLILCLTTFRAYALESIYIDGSITETLIQEQKQILKEHYVRAVRAPRFARVAKSRMDKYDMLALKNQILSDSTIQDNDKEDLVEILYYIVRLGIKNIYLNSHGGELYQAHALGTVIGKLEIATVVPEEGLCASACTYLFHFGYDREMEEGAQLMYQLGTNYKDKNTMDLRECTLHKEKECDSTLSGQVLMKQYRKFIMGLPNNLKSSVIQGNETFVPKWVAENLGIIYED